LDTLNAYVSTRDDVQEEGEEETDDDDETSSLSGLTVEENEERKVRAEAKSNRKVRASRSYQHRYRILRKFGFTLTDCGFGNHKSFPFSYQCLAGENKGQAG
jgi:hypothetical protein